MKNIVFAAIVSALAVGCARPTLDASSEASLRASMDTIKESLGDEEYRSFRAAIGYHIDKLTGGDISNERAFSALKTLNGMSASSIVEEAREKIRADIADLSTRAKAFHDGVEKLAKVTVTNMRIERNRPTGRPGWTVFATLTNGTDSAITNLNADYKLVSPGREVPWVSDSTSFVIRGGLEPGEQREESPIGGQLDHDYVLLASEWEKHPDAKLVFTFVRASLANGDFIPPPMASKHAAEKLDSLRKVASDLSVEL